MLQQTNLRENNMGDETALLGSIYVSVMAF